VSLPIKLGGRGFTLPLGTVVLAFPGSRLDTSDAVGQFPGMRDKQNALAECDPLLADHAAQNDATLPTGLPPSTVASILEMPVHNSQEALLGNVRDQHARILDLHHDLPLPDSQPQQLAQPVRPRVARGSAGSVFINVIPAFSR
jgi:hypothetical protein